MFLGVGCLGGDEGGSTGDGCSFAEDGGVC
jgi:hypothetical protein